MLPQYDQVEVALDEIGGGARAKVDIWVNNAGTDGKKAPFFALPKEDYTCRLIKTNVIGLMNCNSVVIPGMYKQGSGVDF